jgi:maltose alpha-D-glucosyltransferase / alpha-amylase
MQHWYDGAIIYEVPVHLFVDSVGDGIGDFAGLTRALDYLATLGVTCLWLPPFLASPREDGGYDIADYYRVDPRFGSQGDFARFLRQANERGLRVIIDMAFNHTSTEHPWFQAARSSRDSPFRNFYVWSDEPQDVAGDHDVVDSGTVWTYDELAGQYYHHTFFPAQPDLNLGDERVRDEIMKVCGYWLQLGVSGFRLDALPIMVKPKPGTDLGDDPYALLNEMRHLAALIRRDAVLLIEGDVGPEGLARALGDGDRAHMALDFHLAAHVAAGLAKGRAAPIERALGERATPPANATYANFLRSHDELSLRQLPAEERERTFESFDPEGHARIFGTGFRRRLAPLLDGDPRRIRLAHSLLLSMPGTPVLYYGDEIGMGDDLSLHGRRAVRTPMQWSDGPGGGFSRGAPDSLVAPPLAGGPYGFERVNVAQQRSDPSSLLNWMIRALRTRRECPEFGRARRADVLETGDGRVLAHACRDRDRSVVVVHNLSDEEVGVRLDAREAFRAETTPALLEVLSDRAYAPWDGAGLTLSPYGFRWFRTNEFAFDRG